MEEEKRFGEEFLLAILLIGVAFGVVAGMAIYASTNPALQSTAWPAWVQAIGSIAAIFMSAWIGNRQAKAAMEIHTRDVEFRNHQLKLELERQADANASKARQEFENALAETTVHQVAVKRLRLDIIRLCSQADRLVSEISICKAKCAQITTELNQLSVHEASYRRNRSEARQGYQTRVSEALKQLSKVGREADHIGRLLSDLPRGSFRTCSPKLANELAYSINNLHSAALDIEHGRLEASIRASLAKAEKNLGCVLEEIEQLLSSHEVAQVALPAPPA